MPRDHAVALWHALRAAQTGFRGWSMMRYDLKPAQSTRLQQVGLGGQRTLGCGSFVPRKSIAAVAA